jgi:hypothetical protein
MADSSGQTFVFSLKNPRNAPPARFGLVQKDAALWCWDDEGPSFGGWCGIRCKSGSDSNDDSFTNLDGTRYANPTGVKGTEVFTGQLHFRAREIDGYQVV